VLFSYSATDPTYTLARTVAWTSIEMSAGIMSACLPTMRPALIFLFRSVGLKNLTAWGSHDASKAAENSQGTRTVDGSFNGLNSHSRKDSAFTRLHDGSSGDRIDWNSVPAGTALRPDNCSAMVTRVMGSQGHDENLEGDEVPLHKIRVQTDFKRTDK
jgi:hypothetical protein